MKNCEQNKLLNFNSTYTTRKCSVKTSLLDVFRGSSTSNNIHEFGCDDRLSSSIVKDCELANHVTGVLGSVLEYG
jgi:hypothetical protein